MSFPKNYELMTNNNCRYDGQNATIKSINGSYASIELEDGVKISVPLEKLNTGVFNVIEKWKQQNSEHIENKTKEGKAWHTKLVDLKKHAKYLSGLLDYAKENNTTCRVDNRTLDAKGIEEALYSDSKGIRQASIFEDSCYFSAMMAAFDNQRLA